MAETEIPLSDLAPSGVPTGPSGRPRVVMDMTPKKETELSLADLISGTGPSTKKSSSQRSEGWLKDKEDLTDTAITTAGTNVLGLPGSISRGLHDLRKQNEAEGKTAAPLDYDAMGVADPEVFHQLVGKHLPTGEEVKDWFYSKDGPGGKLGMPRRDPEGTMEKMYTGAVENAIMPFSGPKSIAAAAGGIGAFAESLFPNHPALANFAAQMLTLLGGGKLVKDFKVTKDAAPKIVHDIAGGTPEERVGQAIAEKSGLKGSELDSRLSQGEIVPGSQPTTAQLIGTPEARTLEDHAISNVPGGGRAFEQLALEQDAARKDQAGNIAPTGDVNAPGSYLRDTQKAIETKLSGLETKAADEVRTRLAALGPDAKPEDAGRIIREVTEKHYEEAGNKVTQAFRDVIEPARSEKVLIDTAPAVRRIDRIIQREYNPKTRPPNSDIKELRDLVANVAEGGKPYTFKEMDGLVTRAQETYLKLKDKLPHDAKTALDIKDILMQRLDASASDVLKLPESLQGFSKASEADTIAQRLVRLNELRDINGEPPIGWKRSRAKLEDRIKKTELEMRKDFGVEGNMNPAEYDRYLAAKEMRKQVAEKYEKGAVGDTLDQGRQVGNTKLTDSQVASRYWHTRSTAPEDMAQFSNTLGGDQQATAALRDYAVGNLRAIAGKDGTELTEHTLRKYLRDHEAVLNTPIGQPIKRELTDLQRAREAISNAHEDTTQLLSDYNKSAARHFLSDKGIVDPEAAIRSALKVSNKTGRDDMVQLVHIARTGPPEVMEGLKAAIRDDFLREASNAGKRTEGILDAKKARNWLDTNKDRIAPVLGRDHVNNIETIVTDLERATPASGKNARTLIGELEESLNGKFNLIDAIPVVKNMPIAKWLNAVGIKAKGGQNEVVRDLFHEAMLDPKLAKLLTEKFTSGTAPKLDSAWKKINRHLDDAYDTNHGIVKNITGPTAAAAINAPSKADEGYGQ